jgi:hypothetical protein
VTEPERHLRRLSSVGEKGATAMSRTDFPNSEFLINRAKQCRSMARILASPLSRDRMIDLARGYEELSKAAAELTLENFKIEELED